MNVQHSLRFGALLSLILLAAFTRLIPHAPNFTAVGAMALFGGAYFSRKSLALLVPLLALWLSDILLNNLIYRAYYPTFTLAVNPWTYGTFALLVGLGALTLKNVTAGSVVVSSLTASVVFFLISNFSVWLGSPDYPQNATGLLLCYLAGEPFFWNTLLGDLFYCGLLFGSYELARRWFPQVSF